MANRIALVVVHGVADQPPGATVRAVVDLLVAAAPSGAVYTAVASQSLTLAVDPLQPRGAAPQPEDATPSGAERPAIKALLQSARSDFQRPGWTAPHSLAGAWAARGTASAGTAARDAPSGAPVDRGIAATDYLLTKHRNNGAQREAYETTRIELERASGAQRTQLAVYEMYWADLSRLSGALPRIVTELFTMVFRLSKLGRDTVDEARGALRRERGTGFAARTFGVAWWWVAGLQILLDWLFANGLALLFVQLSLLAIVLALLGLASAFDMATLHRVAAGGVAIAGLLLLAYRYRDARAAPLIVPGVLIVAGSAALLFVEGLRPWIAALTLLGGVTLIGEAGLRVSDERFPFVRHVGRCLWAAVVLAMLASVLREGAALRTDAWADAWMHAALFASELVLLAVKWWWIAASGLIVVWWVAGAWAAAERGHESSASVATGRLGLSVSVGTFLMLAMALWALASNVLDLAVRGAAYSPCIFAIDAASPARLGPVAPVAASAPPNVCPWTTASVDAARAAAAAGRAATPVPTSAQLVLADRYQASTAAFSLIAAVLIGLVVYLAAMFAPSLLAEMKLLVERHRAGSEPAAAPRPSARSAPPAPDAPRGTRARRLGRWLTTGYRSLDGVVGLVSGLGVVFALAVALAFAGVDFGMAGVASLIAEMERLAPVVSRELLKPLVLSAAGVAAALTLLGGVLSRYLPALRAPLDIALDVDNHFREFPRNGIPRARIFSRFAALLAHVAAQQPERIVIVAHSQGSVISAELLRYLASRAPGDPEPISGGALQPPKPGDRPRVDGRTLASISLLTLGCPLRQLYAARFPTLYRWVLAQRGSVSGPLASDLGVERWVNAFCSGDYIGRWLWSDAPSEDGAIGHPMLDSVDASRFGRTDAYAGFDPFPPAAQRLAAAPEVEVCLGLGAHTHYFERDQATVAWLIDHLVEPARGGAPSS